VISRLRRTQVILPGTYKEFIQVVMQVAVDQHIPFIVIEPDAVAVAAAVDKKAVSEKL
jgi:hypothetical protein